MDDLISRAAALNELRAWREACAESGHRESASDLKNVIRAFGELPSAQPGWIPCGERLPEHGGWYITTYRITKDNDKCVGLLWYSTAHGWEWNNAIAWMPLPEPYSVVLEGRKENR